MSIPTTKIPDLTVQIIESGEKKEISTTELFKGKTILFGLPGAFTPTCSQIQLPSFVTHEKNLREKGYEKIICMAVNDAFVMQAWKEQIAPNADIIMLADGSAALTKALNLGLDLTEKHMGFRCTRFLLVLENSEILKANIEKNPGTCEISGANSLL
ncbi:MAG: redoxin family protein [Pseudomonadota bacterium]|jgi:peroxiredoxin|nr:peroxiredoxin [Alphaproteobacteria bacterium]